LRQGPSRLKGRSADVVSPRALEFDARPPFRTPSHLGGRVKLSWNVAHKGALRYSPDGGYSEGQIRVLREFPHYGGRRLEPEYNSQGRFVAFTTEDPPEGVRSY
jgi:hypothetical protein